MVGIRVGVVMVGIRIIEQVQLRGRNFFLTFAATYFKGKSGVAAALPGKIANCYIMRINKALLIIITLLQAFRSSDSYGQEYGPKKYLVKPLDVVCDYPFDETNRWAITCRIWGLLKYFHPNVVAGQPDWDEVLIKTISRINRVKTVEGVNTELMEMIRIAGAYKCVNDGTWNDSLNMNVDLCWIDNSFINDTIKQALKEIASLTVIQPSHYTRSVEKHGLSFFYEKDIQTWGYSYWDYRLLALFRFWNVIYYFYPYKHLMDQSWDEILTELIPEFVVRYEIDRHYVHSIPQEMATRLNKGSAPKNFSYHYLSLVSYPYLTQIDSSTVIRTPPEGSSLERGDVILSLDGKNIKQVRDSVSSLLHSHNQRYTDNVINGWLLRHNIMDSCSLTVLRNNQELSVHIFNDTDKKYLPGKDDSPPSFYTVSPDIGYVNLHFSKAPDFAEIFDSLKDCKGIIFDLRHFPAEFEDWELFCHLSSTQEFVYGLEILPDMSHCGAFYEQTYISKCPDERWQKRKKYSGKIVALINGSTFGFAENMSLKFRAHGATLIGTPTAGHSRNVVNIDLFGYFVNFIAAGYYYPNGELMQRTDIIPDIEVYPVMSDIIEGKDEVIEAAIRFGLAGTCTVPK